GGRPLHYLARGDTVHEGLRQTTDRHRAARLGPGRRPAACATLCNTFRAVLHTARRVIIPFRWFSFPFRGFSGAALPAAAFRRRGPLGASAAYFPVGATPPVQHCATLSARCCTRYRSPHSLLLVFIPFYGCFGG